MWDFKNWRWAYFHIKESERNNSPGNKGPTKYFNETFWDYLKMSFIVSRRKNFWKCS